MTPSPFGSDRDRRLPAFAFALAFALASALDAAVANAQPYPNKPIRFIVPGAAGGPTDVPARLVGDALSPLLGQRIVIENRTGAGGVLAGEAVVKSAPDGYTLLYANSSLLAINQALYPSMPYDPATAFVPIAWISNSPQLLVANPKLPYRSIKEMLAYDKANPGKINFATAGAGTLPHLTYELLKLETGMSAVNIPYQGGAPALTAVLAGQADMLFDLIRTRVRSGELRALAITGATRDPDLPDVPTIAESGFAAVTSTSWTGLVGPAGMSAEIVALLHQKVGAMHQSAEFQAKMKSYGLVPRAGTRDEFAAWVDRERERWAKVVKAAGVKPN